jgi:membrane protease YdiL (CAAX protease family)
MGLAAATSLFFSTLYAEGGNADQLGVYHDSYRNGVLVALVLIAAALALGLLDMRSRRKASLA